jgi:hypothetical protein
MSVSQISMQRFRKPLVGDHQAQELSPIVCSGWRFSTLWMVGSLFLFGMCATFLFATTSGSVRIPAGVAAAVAPWVGHLVLTRRARQG